MHKLEGISLKRVIGKKEIVSDFSFYIKSGEIVGLLGPNGAGKTTSFYMICGLSRVDGGKVLLDNEDITPYPLSIRARKGIGYLPQESSIFSDLSVEDNLYIAAEATNLSKEKQQKIVEDLLNRFNIEPIRDRLGFRLSGGERRRVEIARALVGKPKFLLLDEPFAGVDPIAVSEIQKIIEELSKENIGILITDHNVRETLGICDRAYVMRNGKVLAQGDSKEIAQDKLVRKYYLGEEFKI